MKRIYIALVIGEHGDLIKIGSTKKDPQSRAKEYAKRFATKVSIINEINFPDETDIFRIEKTVHDSVSTHRVPYKGSREVFDVLATKYALDVIESLQADEIDEHGEPVTVKEDVIQEIRFTPSKQLSDEIGDIAGRTGLTHHQVCKLLIYEAIDARNTASKTK